MRGMRLIRSNSGWCRSTLMWAAFCIAAVPTMTSAVDKPWTGSSSTTWSTNGNWTGNAPAAGDNAVFNGTFTNQPNLTGNASAGGIWMTGSIGQSVVISATTGTLTLQGSTINGTAGLGILVDNANAFSLTISAPLKVGTAQTWTNSSVNLLSIGAVDTNTKALTINGTGDLSLTGIVSNTGSITKSGTGTLTLSNTNTYTGGTTINGGTVVINSAASLGATSGGATVNAGTVEVSTGFSTSRVYTLGNAASTFKVDPSQTFTVTSAIGGTGALNKTGTGTMVLSGSNTYAGGTNINGGILQVNNAGALNSSGTISFGGGTLQYTASNATDYSARFNTGANQAYKIDTNSQNVTLATALTSSGGSLTKAGTGTLTLTGTNTFTGATTVNGGTLLANAAGGGALSSTSSITVNSGGTLQLGAANQINDSATLTLAGGTLLKGSASEGSTSAVGLGALTLSAAGSHIDFGNGTVGVLTFANFNPSTFTLVIDNWTGVDRTIGNAGTDRLIFDSDQSANLNKFSFTGFVPGAIEFNLGNGYWEVVAAPEAGTWVSGSLACAVVSAFHIHRRRRTQELKRRLPARAL